MTSKRSKQYLIRKTHLRQILRHTAIKIYRRHRIATAASTVNVVAHDFFSFVRYVLTAVCRLNNEIFLLVTICRCRWISFSYYLFVYGKGEKNRFSNDPKRRKHGVIRAV